MRRIRSGFTLVEVVFSMVLLSVAILGSVELIAQITFSTEQNREMSLAQDAARTALDGVVDLAREDIDKVVASYNADPADDPDGPGTAPGPDFDVTGLHAQDADGKPGAVAVDATDPNLLDVTATVSWKGIKGLQDYTLQTRLARLTEAAP